MGREVKMPVFVLGRDNFDFWRDLENFTTAQDGLTSVLTGAGAAVAAIDGIGGLVTLTTGGVLANEAILRSTQALWQVAANRPLFAECRLQYAEANVNNANVAFGLADTVGTGWMQGAGAGPRTSGNQIMIYKAAGGTSWRAQARNGTQVTDSNSTTAAGGTAFTILRVEAHDMSTTQVVCTYSVDGVPLRDATSGLLISHLLNISGSALLRLLTYVQAGSATGEVATADYLGASQVRF